MLKQVMADVISTRAYSRTMAKFSPFDAADYLDDDETISEYITAALEDSNPDVFFGGT
jgi:DNA-binding phage protein